MGRRLLGGCLGSLVLGSALLGWSACGGSVATAPADASTQDTRPPEAGPEIVTPDVRVPIFDAGPSDTSLPQDATPAMDASFGNDGAILCPSAPCTGSQLCCVVPPSDGGALLGDGGAFQCMDACPDGGGQVQCEGPEGCSGSTPECCATVSLVGTGFACMLASAETQCVATCTEQLSAPLCPATQTVKLCNSSADCMNASDPVCCETPYTGTLSFCAPTIVQQLPGVVCH